MSDKIENWKKLFPVGFEISVAYAIVIVGEKPDNNEDLMEQVFGDNTNKKEYKVSYSGRDVWFLENSQGDCEDFNDLFSLISYLYKQKRNDPSDAIWVDILLQQLENEELMGFIATSSIKFSGKLKDHIYQFIS